MHAARIWGNTFQTLMAAATAITLVSATVFLASCEGGGNTSGNSTITGNVSSYSAGSALFLPTRHEGGVARFLLALGDFLVPSAQAAAAVQGVHIKMVGTDLETDTDADGMFTLSGVPDGNHQMEFDYNGNVAFFNMNVPDNAIITMNNIHVAGSMVTMAGMRTNMMSSGSMSAGPGMGMN